MSKKNLYFVFFLLSIFQTHLISPAETEFDAKLHMVNNKTLYDLFVNGKQVPKGRSYDGLRLNNIPKPPDPGIEFKGIGYNEIPFKTGEIVALQPLDSIGFAWLDEEFAKGQVTVVFQAKADMGDIQVVFGQGIAKDYTYKVVIGGNNNTESLIVKQDVVKSKVTQEENPDAMAGILETQESEAYPQYWVCYNNGLIIVGKGVPGDNIFLSWRDPDFDPFVSKVGFSSNKVEVRYTNIQLLPALVTVPPTSVYESLNPVNVEPKKIGIEKQDNFIKYGGVIKIKNLEAKKDLQVMPATTKVVCSDNAAWESYWIIKGPHGTDDAYKFGDSIRSGSTIRLEYVNSRKNLNYKERIDVSGENGIGEGSNNWIVNIISEEKGKFWEIKDQINLVNVNNKENLSCKNSTSAKEINVIGSKDADSGSLWVVENYQSPVTKELLPTGSIITLKNKLNKKYLEEIKSLSGNKISFGESIMLVSKQEVPPKLAGDTPILVETYLTLRSDNKLETNINPPGAQGNWEIFNAQDPNGRQPIKFGDPVYLKSKSGKYLGSNGEGTSDLDIWMIVNANNPLSRDDIKRDDSISLKSIRNDMNLSANKDSQITLKGYISGNETWMFKVAGKEGEDVPLMFADALNTDALRTRFKVIRFGGWIGLQSLSSGKNVEAEKKDWMVSVNGENFYDNEFSRAQFLIRKIKDDYFVLSRETNGTLNLFATPNKGSQTIKTDNKNKTTEPAGYEDSAKMQLDVLSIPQIKILQATYEAITAPDRVFEVSDIVQSRVMGPELIIPAGRLEKNKLFGDPAPGLEKQLVVMYEKDGQRLTETINDQEALLLGVKQEFAKTNILDVLSMNGEYVWLDNLLRIPGRGAVVFDVKTAGEVYVAFAKIADVVYGTDVPLYEIVIGGNDGNETILHRRSHEGKMIYSSTPNIVTDDGKFHRFWFSINGGLILFGEGNLGEKLLLAFKDKDPLTLLERVGIASGNKPLICQNIKIAPPVNLEIPFNMIEEYKQKLQTLIESTRLLKIIYPFTYVLYHDGVQVRIKDSMGYDQPIGVTARKNTKEPYDFTLHFVATGDPYLLLEYEPEMGGKEKALRISAATLSSVAEPISAGAPMAMMGGTGGALAAGAGMMGVGAALGGVATAMQTATDIAYSPVENVRSEQYKNQMLITYPDSEVQSNNQIIAKKLAFIEQLDPTAENHLTLMIENYVDIVTLIVNPDNVNPVLKERITRDLYLFIKQHELYPLRLYNDLINLLIKAHNNPFLFTQADKNIKEYLFTGINNIARTLFRSVDEVELEELYGEYLWLEQELPKEGSGAVIFEAKGFRDIFVTFSSEAGKIRESKKVIPLYEMIIGRKGDSFALRLENSGYLVPSAMASQNDFPDAMPDSLKFKKYWFSISTKQKDVAGKKKRVARIVFGQGDFKEENKIIDWEDREPYQRIKYIGFGSWASRLFVKNIKVGQPLGEGTETDFVPVIGGAKVIAVKENVVSVQAPKPVPAAKPKSAPINVKAVVPVAPVQEEVVQEPVQQVVSPVQAEPESSPATTE